MKITDILKENNIIPELKSRTKEELIDELVNLFRDDQRTKDIAKVKDAVLEREKIMSTGVGKGFAIPHAKTDAVTEIIAGFGKTSEPVNFDSLDGKPVNLIFLLVGRDNLVGEHIKLLSRISRMMNNDEFRNKLITSDTREKIYRLFEEEENKFHH